MAKFLIQASYTADGAKGIIKEGGSARKAQIVQLLERQGGRLEAFYYAFGEWDVVAIFDVPDTATVTALSMAINASGGVMASSGAGAKPGSSHQTHGHAAPLTTARHGDDDAGIGTPDEACP
jgi:uncharacterized protein with GYD domain